MENMSVTHSNTMTVVNTHCMTDMFNIMYLNEGAIPSEEELASNMSMLAKEQPPFAFWLL